MTVGCAGKTVKSLENACHTWAPYGCIQDEALYKSKFTLPYLTLHTHTNTAKDDTVMHPHTTTYSSPLTEHESAQHW